MTLPTFVTCGIACTPGSKGFWISHATKKHVTEFDWERRSRSTGERTVRRLRYGTSLWIGLRTCYLAFTGMAQEKSVRVKPANLGSIGTDPSPNEIGFT